MKTFDEIYKELECTKNNELKRLWTEAERENENNKKITIMMVVTMFIFAIIVVFIKKGFFIFLAMIVCIIINLVIIMKNKLSLNEKYNNYNETYKQVVINKLINNFYNNLKCFSDTPMPEYIYKDANYKESYDVYISEDYFEAKINNKYSIQMAEILTQGEIDLDADGRKEIITLFHGLFSKVLIHKSIEGELRIEQNGAMLFDKKRLEMDSDEFEKYFDVKASDDILGMRLLTADIMEELIDFQKNTNIKYDIYIKNNEIYFRFHSGEVFEAGRFEDGPVDKESLREYFYILNLTYNLSNKLINLINNTVI